MNEEIKKKMLLVSAILFKNNVPINEAKEIGSFIENLQQENQRLKDTVAKNNKIYLNTRKYTSEIEGKYVVAQYILDELEKWLKEKIENFKEQIINFDLWHEVGTDINFLILNKQLYEEVLNKLQELKGSDKNE